MRIVQISDTHLSHEDGATNDNFRRIARFINDELHPDLVVHSGDVSILSPDVAADRETARTLFELIEAPLRVVPGNHDVGEPGDNPWAGFSTTSERVAAFTEVFGSDHWLETVDGHAVLGLNSELIASGTAEEQAQWEWLRAVRAEIADRPTLVFCHKPLWTPTAIETDHNMAVDPAGAATLLNLLDGVDVRVFASGHLHHYVVGQHGPAQTISGPSTAFVVTGMSEAGPGLDQLGVVEYRSDGDGVEAYFRSVPDLVEGSPLAVESFQRALQRIGVTLTI